MSTTVFWLQQLVKSGVVTVGACTSAENRADLVTKSLPVHRLRRLRQWSGMVLDRDKNSVTGDKKDGLDEVEQQGGAVRTISDPGQGDEEVLDALVILVRVIRGTK